MSNSETLTFPQGGSDQPLTVQVGEQAQVLRCTHTPPASFAAGEPLTVTCTLESTTPVQTEPVFDVWLHYRHVNQAELIQTQAMRLVNGNYQAAIPADHTNLRYALMYYFSINNRLGECVLCPGLEGDCDAPYFAVDQSRIVQ